MASNIRVWYDPPTAGQVTGQIRITGPQGIDKTIDTSTFQQFSLNGTHVQTMNDNSFTEFQRKVRILDMMKDGKTNTPSVPQPTICQLMNADPCFTYDDLHTIEHNMATYFTHRIKKTTWLSSNEMASKLIKLTTRKAYKESGISPENVILEPQYQSNIASEIIDPFKRTYKPSTTVVRFPSNGVSFDLDQTFLDFFGFSECTLQSTRTGNAAHTYTIGLGLDATGHIFTIGAAADKAPINKWNWFEGNSAKNKFIMNPSADDVVKRALLNVKEMGDVLQVLIMFITKAIYPDGKHTMVTCDNVVYILCMQLGLDCIWYYHKPSADHSVYYFKSDYTIQNAIDEWNHAKATLIEYNDTMIQAIESFIDRPSIQIKSITVSPNFNLCKSFYDAIIADMKAINQKLNELTIESYQLNEQKFIENVGEKVAEMKKNFTIKSLFVNSQQGVTFNSSTTYYTDGHVPLPKYALQGYVVDGKRIKKSFLQIYNEIYVKEQGCRSTRSGGARRHPKQRGGNHENIFNLEFNPVIYGARSEDYNWAKEIYPTRPVSDDVKMNNSVVSNEYARHKEAIDNVETDIHALWKENVERIFTGLCHGDDKLYYTYIDELFQSLYHASYLSDKVFGTSKTKSFIDLFYSRVRNLQNTYDGIYPNLTKSSSPSVQDVAKQRMNKLKQGINPNKSRHKRINLAQAIISKKRGNAIATRRQRLSQANRNAIQNRLDMAYFLQSQGGRRRTKKLRRRRHTKKRR